MDFVVRHRDSSGKVVEKQFTASGRQELFKILSAAKISAISVREGKISSKSRSMRRPPPSATRGLLALVITILIGAALWWFMRPAEIATPAQQDKHVPKKNAEAVPPKIVREPTAPAPAPIDKAKEERIAKLKAMTPGERMQFLFDEAAAKPLDMTPSSNRVFRTGTEQVLSWIFNARLGDVPPVLPTLPLMDEAHLAEILAAPNPALEGDSEKVKEAKEMVELAKKELIDYLNNGGNVEDFLEYYRGELIQANNEWKASQQSVIQVIREEPEIAEEYIKEVNARLAEKGIKPVAIPPPLKKRLGIED